MKGSPMFKWSDLSKFPYLLIDEESGLFVAIVGELDGTVEELRQVEADARVPIAHQVVVVLW